MIEDIKIINSALDSFLAELDSSNQLEIKVGETYPLSYVHVKAYCGDGFSLHRGIHVEGKKSFHRNDPMFESSHTRFHELLGSPCTARLKFEIKPFRYKNHYPTAGGY